jgi:phage head maturation protease
VIVGLPEAPVASVVLRNVKIGSQHGMSVGYAGVTESGVEVTSTEGLAMMNLAGAKVVELPAAKK